ncbi:MAG: MFS transporter [Thermoleophilia bacterium]|nr:MFS transporter [Thermoleophilia bacterium]
MLFPHHNREHRGLGPLLLASATLTVMAGAIIGPVVVEIGRALDLTPTEAGLVITTHGLTIALVSIGAGRLIDRIGPRLPLALGLIIYGIAGGAGLFIRNFEILLLSRVILGIGVAGMFTGVTVALLRAYTGAAQLRMMGYRGAANSLGGAVWPLVGGAAGLIAWYLPFGVYLLGVPLGIAALLVVPDLRIAPHGLAGPAKTGRYRFRPMLLLPYLLMFITNILLYGVVVFFPQRLSQFGIRNTLAVGLFLVVAPLCGAAVATQYGRISRHLSIPGRAAASLLAWIPAFALAALAGNWPPLLLTAMLFGTGSGIMFPTVVLWVDRITENRYQATAASVIPVFGFMGQFLSPVLLGPIAQAWGFGAMFWIVAAIPVAALAPTLLAGLRSSPEEDGRH